MSTKFTIQERYPVTPDQIITMMASPAYLEYKYSELGDLDFTVETQDFSGEALTLKIDRQVAVDASVADKVPSVAKKLLGDSSRMVQTENWQRGDDGWVADMRIDTPGKPVSVGAKLSITPVGETGSDFTLDFDVSVSVPLVAGKVEKIIAEQTRDNLVREAQINHAFLSRS